MRTITTALLAIAVFAASPLSALATEASVDAGVRISSDVAVDIDRPVDAESDRPADRETDTQTDRPSDGDIDRPTDRPSDGDIDRTDETDETDEVRHRCLLTDNPRRCLHDRPHDFDIRHLIWRLIKAHEWEKLFRLLHWLGWI